MTGTTVALNIHPVKRGRMSEFSVKTVYLCERCSKPLHTETIVSPSVYMGNYVNLEATCRVEECDSCLGERMQLIHDLYTALPWEKREQFESPILEELEMMIRGRSIVGYRGVTL